jgi:opacity protein-like surface antigen
MMKPKEPQLVAGGKMPVKRLFVATFITVMILGIGAAAQDKNELAGTIGRTFIADQGVSGTSLLNHTIHSGNGLTFEVDYGRHILGNGNFLQLTLEVPAVFNPDEDLNYGDNVIPESYSSFFVAPGARLNVFADTAISPWVSFGGGFGHFKESNNLVFGGKNPGSTGTTTGVFQFGAGLDVKVSHSLSVRGELRDFDSGVPQLNVNTGKSRQHNIYAGGGIVWHF